MILLAGIVLIACSPLVMLMVQGALAVLVDILYVLRVLFRFLWALAGLFKRQPEPAPPKTTGRKAPRPGPKAPKTARKPDTELGKLRQMAKTWKASGSRVGLVNLDSGEVYEPASSPEQGG